MPFEGEHVLKLEDEPCDQVFEPVTNELNQANKEVEFEGSPFKVDVDKDVLKEGAGRLSAFLEQVFYIVGLSVRYLRLDERVGVAVGEVVGIADDLADFNVASFERRLERCLLEEVQCLSVDEGLA